MNTKMTRLAIFLASITLLSACASKSANDDKKTIFVSITPLKAIVEELTYGDFTVEVLVPQGSSPESYDPTARQLTEASDAQLLFTTGLITFEQNLVDRIAHKERLINLSEGIELLAGCCTHNHKHSPHKHGIDPHIWTSPRALGTMIGTMHRSIKNLYPDSTKYDKAATRLLEQVAELDARCKASLEAAQVDGFMIYHPAYTYYANDYGIRQIAIEQEGKEPSPRQLTTLVQEARAEGIKSILIQPQYNIEKVMPIAKECGAEVVVTDPLAANIFGEIARVTEIICRSNE